ncbi:MAG: hypothetical protein ABIR62_11725 [Dokdonella sp.]|uniref:hypothetical protein n=1 Tax=Dokdonella sp. TaxID=2291710 RepID=UPI003264A491
MRSAYLACFVLAVVGVCVWVRQDPVDAAVAPQRSAMAHGEPPAPSEPAERKASAANTIRSTNLTPSTPARPSSGQSTKPATGAAGNAAAAAPPDATPTTAEVKPASELFSGFVDDDPRNVFLPSSVQYHAAVQSESVDPAWGPAAADALRTFVATQYGNRFELPLVDCRQDLCELRVAGQVGGDQLADMQDFQQLVEQMKQQPWWSALEFDQHTGMIGTAPDGRALLLYFFSRK